MPIQNAPTKPAGVLSRMGMSARRWASSFIAPAQQISQSDSLLYGAGATTVASLLSSGNREARARQVIYDKWAQMEGDPLVSTALRLHVTTALGGHETTGQRIFVETKPEFAKDKRLDKIVKEIADNVGPLLNKEAFTSCYTGCAFGDSYARIYARRGKGLIDLHIDEMLRPQLVQPFERGSRTVGFAVYLGERNFERMDVSQIARLKMPRTQWVPQYGVVEKSLRLALTEDDIDALPIMPAMVGGSFLFNAEPAYDKLSASLLGLVGQRWMDSIDESIVTANMDGMTGDQAKKFTTSLINMLQLSKQRAEMAVKSGQPVLERIRHILPIFGEKQVAAIQSMGNGQGRGGTMSIEDVLLHAKMMAGALGSDIAMLGFADQLSGGLGEGGFFRVSAQAAEVSLVIRNAYTEFANHAIDIHTMNRYGFVFPVHERPWTVNFYGSISALEAERQKTKSDQMLAGAQLVQTMRDLKDIGAPSDVVKTFLAKFMMLDDDLAETLAKAITAAPAGAESGE